MYFVVKSSKQNPETGNSDAGEVKNKNQNKTNFLHLYISCEIKLFFILNHISHQKTLCTYHPFQQVHGKLM